MQPAFPTAHRQHNELRSPNHLVTSTLPCTVRAYGPLLPKQLLCAHPLAGVVGVACLIGCDPGYVPTDVEEAVQQGVGLVMQLQLDARGAEG